MEAQRCLPKVTHLGEDMVSSGFDFSCVHPMMHVEARGSLGPWVHYESSLTLESCAFPRDRKALNPGLDEDRDE